MDLNTKIIDSVTEWGNPQGDPKIPADCLSDLAKEQFRNCYRLVDATPREAWANIRPYFSGGMAPHAAQAMEKYIESSQELKIAGTKVFEWTPKGQPSEDVFVYFHGGAFTLGSPLDLVHIPAPVAFLTGCKIFAVDYPLAPENPFPAAHNTCLAVYEELLKKYDAKNIFFFGDSAGGNLALSVALMAADKKLPLPKGIIAYSPWVDMGQMSETYNTLGDAGISRVLTRNCMTAARDAVFKSEDDWMSRYGSPAYADFSGVNFPPVMLTTGTHDLLCGEVQMLEKKLRESGVNTTFYRDMGLWHNYQQEKETEESLRCAKRSAEFIKNGGI